MKEKVVEILIYLMSAIHDNKRLTEIDLDDLRSQGYTQTEISAAFSWLYDNMPGGPSAAQSTPPAAGSRRSFHEAEKLLLSPDGQGYLIQLSELAVMAAVVAVLWALKRQSDAFFLGKGQPDAPLEPVHWLGIRQGETWRQFGWIFAGFFCIGTLIFVGIAGSSVLGRVGERFPLLPWAVLFAAMNALGEEMTFRAPLLSTSYDVLGRGSALWMTAIYFGLAHFLHGDPSGVPGFMMTAFVAYILGKSMLETRGLFWAWLVHMAADIPIFMLYALSAS